MSSGSSSIFLGQDLLIHVTNEFHSLLIAERRKGEKYTLQLRSGCKKPKTWSRVMAPARILIRSAWRRGPGRKRYRSIIQLYFGRDCIVTTDHLNNSVFDYDMPFQEIVNHIHKFIRQPDMP